MGEIMDRVRRLLELDAIYKRGFTGKGITIAILDTGLYQHPDYKSRIAGFVDMVSGRRDIFDNNGHGTHIAGIIVGNGAMSSGRYRGVAPEANVFMVKVLNQLGKGSVDTVVNAINMIIKNKDYYNIRILNISIGAMVESPDEENSVLVKAVEKAWDAGIVVVAAAGNNGPNHYSITTPGISRKIITVGASDNKEIYTNSGRGPTFACIQKPDIIAPSHKIISCNVMRNYKYRNLQDAYTGKSGTSMSTPIVSGAVALLLQNEPELTPKEVKIRLRDSARNVGLPKNQQGWGMLNIKGLIKF